jgi:hypothetical protein
MKKIIPITAFFLLPFVTLTSFAQFELPQYELPNDHIITYEIDDDTEKSEADKAKEYETAKKVFKIILIPLLIVTAIGLIIFFIGFGILLSWW